MQHTLSNSMKNDNETEFNNLELKSPPSLS